MGRIVDISSIKPVSTDMILDTGDGGKNKEVSGLQSAEDFLNDVDKELSTPSPAERMEQKRTTPPVVKGEFGDYQHSLLYGKDPVFLFPPGVAFTTNDEDKLTGKYRVDYHEKAEEGWLKNLLPSIGKFPGRMLTMMFQDYPNEVRNSFKDYAATMKSEEFENSDPLMKADIKKQKAVNIANAVAMPFIAMAEGYIKSSGVYDLVRDTKNGKTICIETDENGKKSVAFALPDFKEAKEMWNADPAGTALFYIPFMAHAYYKRVAKAKAGTAEATFNNALAEKELAKARDRRQAGRNKTKVKDDISATVAQVVEDQGFMGPDYYADFYNNITGLPKEVFTEAGGDNPYFSKLQKGDGTEAVGKKRTEKIKEVKDKRLTTKKKKAAEAAGITGVKTEKELASKYTEELEAAKTTDEVGQVDAKYEGLVETEAAEETPKIPEKELNAATVEDLDVPGWQVIYEKINEETGNHLISIVPEGMSFEEIMKSGKASSIEVGSFEEAAAKVKETVAKYEHTDEVVNSTLDDTIGIPKKQRRIKPLEEPEKSPFFKDPITVEEDAKIFSGMIKEDPASLLEDPEAYLANLINETNRWYHKIGDEVDIAKVREKLTELAARADDMKQDFIDSAKNTIEISEDMKEEISIRKTLDDIDYDPIDRFKEFKTAAKQAAQWSKRLQKQGEISKTTERPIKITKESAKNIEGSTEPIEEIKYGTMADIKFYSGIPVDRMKALLYSLRKYAYPIVNDSKNIKDVSLVGSSINKKGKDVDILYDLGNVNLPVDSAKAVEKIQEIIESTNGIDLDKYDSHFKVGDRYFHLQTGAGREIVENTEYGRSQKGKPIVSIVSRGLAEIYKRGETLRDNVNALARNSKYSPEERKYLDSFARDIDNSLRDKGNRDIIDVKIDTNKLPEDLINPLVNRIKAELDRADVMDTSRISETMSKQEKVKVIDDFVEANSSDPYIIKSVLDDVVYTSNIKKIENKKLLKEGIKLTSGVDPTEILKIGKYFDKVKEQKNTNAANYKAGAFKRTRETFNRLFIGKSANLERDLMQVHADTGARDVIERMNLVVHATSRSSALADQFKTEILSGLNKAQKEALNETVFARRTREVIDRDALMKGKDTKYKTHKQPAGVKDREVWQAFIDDIGNRHKLTPEQTTEVYRRTDMLFDTAKDQLKQLYDNGIITEEVFEDLQHLDYSRRQLIDIIDPPAEGIGSSAIGTRESGIKELKVGVEGELLETDAIRLLEDLVIRTQNRIMHNNTVKSLYELAEANPDSPIVRIPKKDIWQIGDEQISTAGHNLAGWESINVFLEGAKKKVYMPHEYAREFVNSSREISYELGKWARIVSGSSFIRAMATGVNVGFAVKNIFRDFAYMWIASQHYVQGSGWQSTYSVAAPKAMGQMLVDLKEVARDVFRREGIYKEYVNEGGILDFLSDKDRILKERYGKEKDPRMRTIIDALYYAGNTSELLGRTSLYNRAKKKLKAADPKRSDASIRQEAAYLSRDYLFFGDYGSFVKAADTVIPYFGATVKATQGLFRAGNRNLGDFALKASQAIGLGATLYLINNAINPKAYKDVNKNDKERNLIPPFYMPYTGTDGKEHYFYFKIPKDQGQAFFMQLGEQGMKLLMNEEVDGELFASTMRGLSPVQEIPNIPAMNAILGYVTNKDFWTYADVWKGAQLGTGIFDRENERTTAGPNKPNPISVGIGDVTGLSPDRLNSAMKSMVPKNWMTDAFGTLTRSMFDRVPDEYREMNTAEILSKHSIPIGLKDVVGTTDDMNGIRDEFRDGEIKKQIQRTINNGQVDKLTEEAMKYNPKNSDGSYNFDKVFDYIYSQENPDEVNRLEQRLEKNKVVTELPHGKQFKSMDSMTPEGAAYALHMMLKNKTTDEQQKIMNEFDEYCIVSNVASDTFIDEFSRLEEGK